MLTQSTKMMPGRGAPPPNTPRGGNIEGCRFSVCSDSETQRERERETEGGSKEKK